MKILHSVIISLILLLSATTVHSATYYFHNDHLGTPQVLTDENQAVVWKGAYDPFGQVTETVATVEQNLRFPGQYLDRESGLHYNYFRTYDSEVGRYTQSDPIGLGGGINIFTYVSNNPINYIDPYGLTEWPGMLAGSVINLSAIPVNVYKDENGADIARGVAPPGTPDAAGNSPGGIDWDFAWINCECIRVGPGPVTVREDGSLHKSMFWSAASYFAHGWGREPDGKCPPKPSECDNCGS